MVRIDRKILGDRQLVIYAFGADNPDWRDRGERVVVGCNSWGRWLAAIQLSRVQSSVDRDRLTVYTVRFIASVEGRDSFHYVSQIEWNDEGYYDVVYFTTDKARVELKVDAVTGKNR